MKSSFLVSCVGAYDDSGIGTGGIQLIEKEKNITLDYLDCTGLFRKGSNYFRFIRGMQTLIGYNEKGVFFKCVYRQIKDCHDIHISNSFVVFVSTNSNQIYKCDFLGNTVELFDFEGNGDAWHLNCLEVVNDEIYVTAFGDFTGHREWNSNGCKDRGFLMQLSTRKKIVEGLNGPHHPRYIDNNWFICDSHKNSLNVYDQGGKLNKTIDLGGFTRGLTYDNDSIYIGVSANRKNLKKKNSGRIMVLSRKNLKNTYTFNIDFPEIYDIICCDEMFSNAIRNNVNMFRISNNNDALNQMRRQIFIMEREYHKVITKLEKRKSKQSSKQKIKKLLKKLIK